MKKFVGIVFLIFVVLGIYFLLIPKKQEKVVESNYKVEFNSDLTTSNLYQPNNLRVGKVSSDSAEIFWNFDSRNLTTDRDTPNEYLLLSGYRIYRNNQWYLDLSGQDKSFTDTGLFPGKTYTYQVSALTFDNKIEGLKSGDVSVTVSGSPKLAKNNIKIDSVLIEGDSIAKGQRANPGSGWADQVANWSIKNGTKKFSNMSKENTFSLDLVRRIESELSTVKPSLLIVGVGMNDLFAGKGDTNITAYKLNEYLNNYKKVIQICDNYNVKVVIVGVTPARGKMEKVAVWNSALEDLSYSTNSIFIPTDYLTEHDLVDMIHPNQEAHDAIAQKVISLLYTNLR
jgi:lysophospholipase L1-like esterase